MCHKHPCDLLGGRRGNKCPFCLRKTKHGRQTSVTRKTSICQTNDEQNSLISRLRRRRKHLKSGFAFCQGETFQWRIQGWGPEGPAPPPLFFDQTEARRAEKKFLKSTSFLYYVLNKFTTLYTQTTLFCKIRLFCRGKFGSFLVSEPVKLTGNVLFPFLFPFASSKCYFLPQMQLQVMPSHFF